MIEIGRGFRGSHRVVLGLRRALFNRQGADRTEAHADGAVSALILKNLQVEAEHVERKVGAGAHASRAGNALVAIQQKDLVRFFFCRLWLS